MSNTKRYVLAIDPALYITGIAILELETEELVYADKIITSNKVPENIRIMDICIALNKLLDKYNISDIVLEDGYCGTNMRTSLQLAELRGAIVFSFNNIDINIRINHMMPSHVRKILGCGGNSSKEIVAKAVTDIFKGTLVFDTIGEYTNKQNKTKTSDIYDAIAIGIAFIKKQKDDELWTKDNV